MLSNLLKQALGFDESALQALQQGDKTFLLHQQALPAFLQLKQAAAEQGFDLSLASSYRSFARQALIWNEKAQGKRVLLDAQSQPLVFADLNPQALLEAILCWTAVPGFSRHHWGCDIDVFDANTMRLQDVQLIPQEVEQGGAMAALHEWLDERIANNQSFGFFRPYTNQACKVAQEKWHLSYWPVAKQMAQTISAEAALTIWRKENLALLSQLEQQAETIYNDYVCLDFSRLPDWLV